MSRKTFSIIIMIVMLMQVVFPAFAAYTNEEPSYSVDEMAKEFDKLMEDFSPFEKSVRAAKSDDESIIKAVTERLLSYPNVKSIVRDDEDTIVFTLSKGMSAVYSCDDCCGDFSDDDVISKTETVSFRTGEKGNRDETTDAVMFGPFYGYDSSFGYYNSLYQQVCDITANYLGGTSTKILGHNCTPAVLREYGTRKSNAVVIFSGHGEAIDGCSYVNAYGTSGITADDIEAGNALASARHPGYYLVNGDYITNNRTADLSVNSIWWFAACEGMMTQGLCAPLRECGAGCVFGYSRSVTFNYEVEFGYYFWDRYTDGVTVKEAAAYAKSRAGNYDSYYPEHARPIFVSAQDEYVSNLTQNVQCMLSYNGYPAEYLPEPVPTEPQLPEFYKLRFESGEDGFTVSNMPDEESVSEDCPFKLPDNVPMRVRDANPSVSGGTFAGWLREGTDEVYQPGDIFQMPSEDVTLVALWTDVEFTVTYVCEERCATDIFICGETVTLPDAPLNSPDMRFDGWLSDCDGKTYQAGDTFTMPYCDITMTAQLTDLFTVTFKDYDDTELSVRYVEYGCAAEAPENPVREGYTFIGWDVDFSCVTEDMTVTALYVIVGDVNGNGIVNTADATMILKASAGMITLDDDQTKAADVNKNGFVNTADAVLILKYAAGMIAEF